MFVLSSKSENRFFIFVSELWEKQGIFQEGVRNKWVMLSHMPSLYEKR